MRREMIEGEEVPLIFDPGPAVAARHPVSQVDRKALLWPDPLGALVLGS